MKALLLSIRTILRFRTYTAIYVLGLALSLGCVFVLVRYIHQERTVNHFVPEADRTFLTAVFKEGKQRFGRDAFYLIVSPFDNLFLIGKRVLVNDLFVV